MEDDWKYTKTGPKQRLQHINDLGTKRKKRGRPKTTWRRTVEKERAVAEWRSWEQVKTVAANRDKWRNSEKALCATRHEDDW